MLNLIVDRRDLLVRNGTRIVRSMDITIERYIGFVLAFGDENIAAGINNGLFVATPGYTVAKVVERKTNELVIPVVESGSIYDRCWINDDGNVIIEKNSTIVEGILRGLITRPEGYDYPDQPVVIYRGG